MYIWLATPYKTREMFSLVQQEYASWETVISTPFTTPLHT